MIKSVCLYLFCVCTWCKIVLLPRHRTIHHWHMEIMANIIYTCEAKRQKGLLVLISNQKGSHIQKEIVVRYLTIGRTHRDRNATNLDQLIKFPGKKRQKDTSIIVLWMALISVLSETQSRNSACMRWKFCKTVTKNKKANTFSWERSSLLMVLKSPGFGWRKC